MGKVAILDTNRDQALRQAREVLEEAVGKGFEAVVVVGMKNGTVSTCKSKSLDTLSLVGALDLAKHVVLANWESK